MFEIVLFFELTVSILPWKHNNGTFMLEMLVCMTRCELSILSSQASSLRLKVMRSLVSPGCRITGLKFSVSKYALASGGSVKLCTATGTPNSFLTAKFLLITVLVFDPPVRWKWVMLSLTLKFPFKT